MARSRPLKATRTTRYLLGSSDPSVEPSASDTTLECAGRDPRSRLGWLVTPKLEYNPIEFAEWVVSDPRHPNIFVDTSLFDTRFSLEFWESLVAGPARLIVVPSVRRELEPWLVANREHPAAQAILLGDKAIVVQSAEDSASGRFTFEYYVSLLGLRKKVFKSLPGFLEAKSGSAPSDDELRKAREEYHRTLGSRGYLLARKGEEASLANLTSDERLVYAAVATSIRTGRPGYILTKDEDVQEQFYKLLWLLDTHYRGMLLAKQYRENPRRFSTAPLPMHEETFASAFEGSENFMIELAPTTYEQILPALYTPVQISCYVLGAGLTQMTFEAEKEMQQLLDTKIATSGLSTDLFDGKNCHISITALPPPARALQFPRIGVIAQDRRRKLPGCSAVISILDARHAVQSGEGFVRKPAF